MLQYRIIITKIQFSRKKKQFFYEKFSPQRVMIKVNKPNQILNLPLSPPIYASKTKKITLSTLHLLPSVREINICVPGPAGFTSYHQQRNMVNDGKLIFLVCLENIILLSVL